MKKILVLGLLVILFLTGFSGCYEETATNQEATTVQGQDLIYFRNQPIPIYDYSPERDIFIQLYNFRMKNVPTWTVICSNMGTCIDSCPSLGYPLAADVQLTNPVTASAIYLGHGLGWADTTVEQREPNGLFSSKNTAGTWVMCVYGDGRVEPVYTELNATAYAHPVHVNEKGVIVHDFQANPSVLLNTSKLDTNKDKPIQYVPTPTVAAP